MNTKKILSLIVIVLFLTQLIFHFIPQMNPVNSAQGYGQVDVSGIISSNTTWSNKSGPYIVKSNILVDENSTLTIEPGVVVKFDGVYYIKVSGNLTAKGTENEMITFTSNKVDKAYGDWITIDLSDVRNETKTTIQFCLIEYCATGIKCWDSSVDIRNNTIRNIWGMGINCGKSTPKLYDNETRYLNITGNNIIDGGSSDAIYVYMYSKVNIENNTISNYTGSGMRIFCPEYKPRIVNNTVTNVLIGMYIQGSDPIIEGNVITFCRYVGIKTEGRFGITMKPIILNNTLGANDVSIFIHAACTPVIRYNNFIKDYTYHIEHGGNIANNASNNYWGTTNRTRITELIFDFYDDFNYPKVLFEPFLMNRSPGAPNVTINLPPVADAGPDFEVNQTEKFILNASRSYDPDGDVLRYKWDFSNGTSTGWINTSTINHTFYNTGYESIRLYVTDGEHVDDDHLRVKVLYIELKPPIAIAYSADNILFEGDNLTLNGSGSYDPDGEIVSYSWFSDIDGFTSSGEVITIQPSPGLHKFTLDVEDNSGLRDQDTIYIAIVERDEEEEEPPPEEEEDPPEDEDEIPNKNKYPIASANASSFSMIEGDTIILDGSDSMDPDGNITRFIWYSSKDGILGSDAKVETTLTPGIHLITLEVWDEDNGSDQDHIAIMVEVVEPPIEPVQRPVAVASVSSSVINFGSTVMLDSSGSMDPDGTIQKIQWTSSIEGVLGNEEIINIKLRTGIHLITLHVWDNDGNWNSTSVPIAVMVEREVDSDGDGVLDGWDAFPDDPAASVDTDGDGYPNYWNPGMGPENSSSELIIDHYPTDKDLYEIDEIKNGKPKTPNFFLWIVMFLIILVLSSLAIFFVIRSRSSKEDRVLIRMMREININRDQDHFERTSKERLELLKRRRKENNVSSSTYRDIKSLLSEEEDIRDGKMK